MGWQVYRRNEPCNIRRVAECVSNLINIDFSTLTEKVYTNTRKFLQLDDNNDVVKEKRSDSKDAAKAKERFVTLNDDDLKVKK